MISYIQKNTHYLLLLILLLFLIAGVFLPLKELVVKAVTNQDGYYIGFANFSDYFSNALLINALINSLNVSLIVALVSTLIGFIISYGYTHTSLLYKNTLNGLIQMPLFVPSVFPCLGLIYLLGGQGLFTKYFEGFELYGMFGVILGGILFTLPHAILILTTTLKSVDTNLYKVAESLGAGTFKKFTTVTLPSTIYGVISTFFVVFTLTMTDFGIAKILAGQYPMLATEIYKQVIGQQNFSMGSTISLILIIPTSIAFLVDYLARKKQSRLANKQTTISINKNLLRDTFFSIVCWFFCILIFMVMGVTVWGSLVSYWPYNLALTLSNYDFSTIGYNWQPYFNSLYLAFFVGTFGTIVIFLSSYLSYRTQINSNVNIIFRLLAYLPLSIPGTVLGLAYIFAFNKPSSMLYWLNGTMAILVFNTIIHLFSVGFLTFSAKLTKLDKNYEKVGNALGVSQGITFFKIILPLCYETLLDVFFYLFVMALTTVSSVIFLYGSTTMLASIAVIAMDDSGLLAAASAMGSLLLLTSIVMKIIHIFVQHKIKKEK